MGQRRLVRLLVAIAMVFSMTVVVAVATAGPAAADACYTWERTLKKGMSGSDVRQLQIRVAGWMTVNQDYLAIDGVFGGQTEAALIRFQKGYGLTADGIAGSQTYNKIYELQDADCSPAHFAWSEFDDACFGGFSGGKVSEAKVKSNVKRVMWKLEAMRHKLGDKPIRITSGFRSIECNKKVGGASNSQHLYGTAADLVSSSHSLCTLAKAARNAGFSGILGPGYPGHNDHVHADNRVENDDDGIENKFLWSAPNCGI